MASHKIAKNGPADEIELSVAQALFDLENNVADLKKELKPLQIASAKEVRKRSLVYHRDSMDNQEVDHDQVSHRVLEKKYSNMFTISRLDLIKSQKQLIQESIHRLASSNDISTQRSFSLVLSDLWLKLMVNHMDQRSATPPASSSTEKLQQLLMTRWTYRYSVSIRLGPLRPAPSYTPNDANIS